MYSLDARTQNALYKTHKSRIYGADIVEIGIPDFHDLDTPALIGNKQVSLRDMCFDLKLNSGANIFVDVDNATRTGETVFQVKKEDKVEVQKTIDTWIKTNLNIRITWNTEHQYEAKTYRLDPKSRNIANQLTAIANELLKPPPNPNTQPNVQKSAPKSAPGINAWVDLTQVKKPPPKMQDPSSAMLPQEDEATVTTLSESTWHSVTLSRQEATEKFKRVGSNLKNLSYRHKKLEAGQECLETAVGLKMNQLFRCFELHHNRLERLEAARERHAEIQLQHIQVTLNPAVAQRDGTLAKLEKMVEEEQKLLATDRKLLETDHHQAFAEKNEEDEEYQARQEAAGRMFDYFYHKLEEKSDADSDFDIENISEVSYEDRTEGEAYHEKNRDISQTGDVGAMDTTEDFNEIANQPNEVFQKEPSNTKRDTAPSTWGSDDDNDVPSHISSPPLTNPTQWTTTPTRPQRTNTSRESEKNSISRARSQASSAKARKLFRKAFSPRDMSNRFSALEEEHHTTQGQDQALHKTNSLAATPPENDHSTPDSEYSDNEELEDDSLDDMSLVSGSEIQGLEEDLHDFDDEGYDTETTDNTSPSHKRKNPSRRSRVTAQERIANFYATPDSFDTTDDEGACGNNSLFLHTQPSPSSHPSLDTTPPSEGHGTPNT